MLSVLHFFWEDLNDTNSRILVISFQAVFIDCISFPLIFFSTIPKILEKFVSLNSLVLIYMDNFFATYQVLLDTMEESVELFQAFMPLYGYAYIYEFALKIFQFSCIFTKYTCSIEITEFS